MKSYSQYKDSELCNTYNWHKLIKMSREEVVALQKSWKENEKLNKEIWEENKLIRLNIIKQIEGILEKNNIEFKQKIPFGSKSKKKYQPFYQKFIEHICELKSYVPYSHPYAHGGEANIDGVKVYNTKSPTPILELFDNLTIQIERAKKQERVNENHFIECVKQANKNNIDILNLTKEQIVDKVETFLKNEYMKSNYPEGKTIDIDDNYCECETFTIGDRRCFCGNRRISFWVDGNCLNGYYLTVEPY